MSEGVLYIVVLKITECKAKKLPDFIQELAKVLGAEADTTKVIHKFKVTGEPRIVAVLEVFNVLGLERTLTGLNELGVFDVTCTPLIPYEKFATNLGVEEKLTKPSSHKLPEKNLYWLDISVEYPGKTTKELLEIWKNEAIGALTGRAGGKMEIDLFKAMADRKVHVFLSIPDPSGFDKGLFDFPLFQEIGSGMHVTTRAVQSLDEYISSHGSS